MSKSSIADPTPTPRTALGEVQRSLADATKVHAVAADNATKARAFVDEAEASLARFDRTDETGGDHLAKSIAAWTSGGPRPSLASPPDVAALRAGRLAATDDLAAARSALGGLMAKAAEAAGKVTALTVQLDNLCVLIMRQEEAALVARVKAADAACQSARDTLEAFLGLHVGIEGRASLFPAQADTVALFHNWPTTPQRPIGGGTLEQRWPASSRHCFALDKWSPCRLVLCGAVAGAVRREGVARPERRPSNGGDVHAATRCDRRLK